MTPRISMVITAHNAAPTLGRCLHQLDGQQGIDHESMEIVVVDDRSTDGTGDVALESGIPGLRVVRVDDYGDQSLTARQVALHVGLEHAHGEVVLLVDADATLERDWCTAMATPLHAGVADVTAGGVAFDAAVPGIRARIVAALQSVDAAYYFLACRLLNASGSASGVLFGNAAFRREVYGRVGGFARIGHALTEDLAFARAAKANGARLRFLLRARVHVAACRTVREVVRRAVRTSAGGASILAASLGAWMLSLILTGVAAGSLGGFWWWVFAARYVLGVLFTVCATASSGQWRYVPYACVYESVAILLGARVVLATRRTREVEWAGVFYDRNGRQSATT